MDFCNPFALHHTSSGWDVEGKIPGRASRPPAAGLASPDAGADLADLAAFREL
jgi:hypothetical protein